MIALVRDARSWRFQTVVEVFDPRYAMSARWRESPWVFTWDAALVLLDAYPWAHFRPLMVNPSYRKQVQTAVEDRLNASNLDRWRQLWR